jgi:hypothetical protein
MTLDVGTKRRLCERRGANDHDWTLAALPNRSENSNPKLEAERNEKWLMSEKNCRRRAVHDAGATAAGMPGHRHSLLRSGGLSLGVLHGAVLLQSVLRVRC